MTQDEKIEKAISKIIEMYSVIEEDLIRLLASHFKLNDEFLNSDYWRIQKLAELGLFNEEVITYLSKTTKTSKKDIKKALEDIKVNTMDINKLKGLYKNGKVKINPNVLLKNKVFNTITNRLVESTSNRFIEITGMIKNGMRDEYLNIVEQGFLKTSTGTHSYQEAIREAINELGNKGITTMTYLTSDGKLRQYNIESTARREILTAARQLSGEISQQVANDLDAEYYYLSEHLDCRPTHFEWQGTVIKKEDFEKPLPEYPEYGSAAGIYGPNCRHYHEPYFGDPNDVKKQYTQEQCNEAYKISQKQRYLERGIRAWKRKLNADVGANESQEQIKYDKAKISEWVNKIDNFAKDNNVRRDFSREYVTTNNYQNKVKKSPIKIKKTPNTIDINTTKETNSITELQIDENKQMYENITKEFLSTGDSTKNYGTSMVESVTVNGKEYKVNKQNKIELKNREKENAEWFLNMMGGKIEYMPEIGEDDSISMADYLYYPIDGEPYYIDNKEIILQKGQKTISINNIVSKVQSGLKQANTFIIDVTNANLTDKEIIERVERVYTYKKISDAEKTLIIKNGEKLFGIFKDIKK